MHRRGLLKEVIHPEGREGIFVAAGIPPAAGEIPPVRRDPVTIRDQQKALENQKQFLARIELYRQYGHDREKAMRFICDQASPFEMPVLEIGCGKGLTALELVRRVPSTISLDVSEEELSYARLNLSAFRMEDRVHLIRADGASLPFLNRSFHTVFIVNALHHLSDPGPVFSEIERVVDYEGLLVLSDFTRKGFQIINQVHGLEEKEHNRFTHSMEDAVSQLISSGFELISRQQGHQEDVSVLRRIPRNPRARCTPCR